jgi:predicted DNA binding CopG/RHH family protein
MTDAKRERRARIKGSLKDGGEYKFASSAAEQEAESIVVQAEKDLSECHVNFRWQREQLDLVKRAAEEIGVPYQTYIKLCVFRQAKQDLGFTASESASKAEFDSLRNLVQANEQKLEAIIQANFTKANLQTQTVIPTVGYADMVGQGSNTSMCEPPSDQGLVKEAPQYSQLLSQREDDKE